MAKCPLLAQSGHELVHCTCPLSGVKRTSLSHRKMSAKDPKADCQPPSRNVRISFEAIRKAALRIRRAPRRPTVFPILKVSAQTVCLRSLHTPSSHVLAVGPSRELVLLVLIFAHFKLVHFFDQQFNYHSSFGFACRRIAQSAVEHNVTFLQEPLHRSSPPEFSCLVYWNYV